MKKKTVKDVEQSVETTTLPTPLSAHSDKVEQIELTLIGGNPNNPRKHYPEEAIQELADSISLHGVIQPITLRKVEDGYQIVCGERRFRAAKMAGLTSIGAIVRPYTEEQAIEITIIENLQRKDISPMEEATSFLLLMKEHHYTVEDLIKRFGKSDKYIRGRLQLSYLIDEVAQLLNEASITISIAMIVASYSPEIQKEVYAEHLMINDYRSWKNLTASKFQEHITSTYSSNLDSFNFDKGECLICNYNTANNTLFADAECGRCTNRICLRAKQQQHMISFCKQQMDVNPTLAFCITPNANANEELLQAIGEAGGEIYEIPASEYPVNPEKPKREDYDTNEDFEEATQEHEKDYNSYQEEVTTIEEKITSGDFQKLIDVSNLTPKLCYRSLILEKNNDSTKQTVKENPVEKLRERDARNKAIVIEKTVDDVKKMLAKAEIPSYAITDTEDELLYFIMLGNLRQDHHNIFSAEENYSYITDNNKAELIKNLTSEQKAIIKRDFIVKHLSNTKGENEKSKLLLNFAHIHYGEQVNKITKLHESVYKTQKKSIMKQLQRFGASLKSTIIPNKVSESEISINNSSEKHSQLEVVA